MFHNVLMTALTPLRNTDEINCWQNRPFTAIWPEDNRTVKSEYQPKSGEVTKTIKKRSKRIRTAYTTDQLRLLERTFNRIKYIDADKRKKLSESLKISEKSIKVWFQNRRMKEKRESSEYSSDSSAEVTTTELSPRPISADLPIQEVKMEPEIRPNEFHNKQDSTNTSHYQLPNFHFCNYQEYPSAAPVMHATEPFTNDRSVYPTYYYPTLEDYYYGENYRYENGYTNTNEAQWSASNFDLNYFQ